MSEEVKCGNCEAMWLDSPAMPVSIGKWKYCPYCATELK